MRSKISRAKPLIGIVTLGVSGPWYRWLGPGACSQV
jgi:hypothetical protein